MVRKTTFIHAADLHLGSPLKSIQSTDPRLGSLLRRALPCAFDRMIDEAIGRNVDFLLISGDVFDSSTPAYSDAMHFVDGMVRLRDAGIPVFVCAGNHDSIDALRDALSSLPENVTLFCDPSPRCACVERGGSPLALVVGCGFSRELPQGALHAMSARSVLGTYGDNVPFVVGMMHTGLDVDGAAAPVSPARLRETDLDYWALGHIHKRFCDDPADPRIVFSGCIQGRDINEPGDCGCNLVRLEEGAPNKVDFLPLSPVAWQRVDVDIAGAQDAAQVERLVEAALWRMADGLESDYLLARVSLEGESPLRDSLARKDVLDGMRMRLNGIGGPFACDRIECRVHLPFDRDALYDQGLFPAALLSSIDLLRGDPSAIQDLVREGLAQRGIDPLVLSDAEARDLCNLAEGELLSLLMGGFHA